MIVHECWLPVRWMVAAGCLAMLAAGCTGASAGRAGSAGLHAPGAPVPGSRLWASRFAGPGAVDDLAKAVAVSPGGAMVFVTGSTGRNVQVNALADYATIGYVAATGKQLWASRYNGPGKADDFATAIAVTPDGRRVIVTGYSDGTLASPGNSADYATVAYSATTGKQLWASRYNGPGNDNDYARSVAVSPDSRTVVVTGSVSGKTSIRDYATIAYDAASGRRLWVRSYHGGAGSADDASAVIVSPDGGTVFVTGSVVSRGSGGIDYGTIAYDARTGARRWISLYRPTGDNFANAIRVSPDGRTLFVTGTSHYDFATVAYNAATGAQRWASRWDDGGNFADGAHAVAVSPGGGALFVTGFAATNALGRRPEVATVAYNAHTGARLWARRYRADGQCRNEGTAIAVGPGGRTVLVTGDSNTPNPAGARPCDSGVTTVAYRAMSGRQLWLQRVRATAAYAGGLAVSRTTDQVFVTGAFFRAPSSGFNYQTVAYRG